MGKKLIKLQWVNKEYFDTEEEYWNCAIPDDEMDQAVKKIITSIIENMMIWICMTNIYQS